MPMPTCVCGGVYVITSIASGEQSLASAQALLVAEARSDSAGWDATGPGDVDGDGFDDLLVGAFGHDTAGQNAGAAYVVRGPVTGDVSLVTADLKMLGEGAEDRAGAHVSGAGDQSGDGLPDLLVGAAYHDVSSTTYGAAYVVVGSQTGSMSLSSASAKLEGADTFGSSVSRAGDVDGDGMEDVLVASFFMSDGGHLLGWRLALPRAGQRHRQRVYSGRGVDVRARRHLGLGLRGRRR